MRQRFSNTDPRPTTTMTLDQALSVAWRTLFHAQDRLPLETLPDVRPDWDAFQGGGFRFIWFGHSTVALRIDGLTVLVDPVLSPTASPVSWLVPRFQPAACQFDDLPQVDVVVISHDHYDHLDRALVRYLALHQGTHFVVPTRVGRRLVRWGLSPTRITELGWDEFVQVSTVRFTATECHHSSRRGLFDGQSTLWASWAIHGDDASVFYTGDSGYGDHWRQIGEKHGPFDVVFAENGQYDVAWPGEHMQPAQTVAAVRDLRGALFVPVHWGMFDLALHHWSESVRRSCVEADAWGVPVLTPIIGQVTGSDTQTYRWWQDLDARDPRLLPEPTFSRRPGGRPYLLEGQIAAMEG